MNARKIVSIDRTKSQASNLCQHTCTLTARTFRKIRRSLLVLMSAVSIVLTSLLFPQQASARSILCERYDHGCLLFSGYNGQSTWGYPVDSRGHNCTNYAAYRLARNGVNNPGNLGDGYQWADSARSKGIPVNSTPAVGSIAQWNKITTNNFAPNGHVAYVEAVTDSYIEVTESNWGGPGRRTRHDRGQWDWPSNFIHFNGSGTFNGVGNATYRGSTLTPGQQIGANQYTLSDDGRFVLMMQDDGNLVIYGPGRRAYWASNTAGNSGAFLAVQGDGNIVIYTSAYRPIWASHTYGKGTQRLVMQGDGNLVAYTSGDNPVWASHSSQAGPYPIYKGGDQIQAGQVLNPNEYLRSGNQLRFAVMQDDGNLVLYEPGYMPYWASNTGGNSGAFLAVQGDGNIVIYTSAYRPIWASHTYGKGTQRLVMQGDGNLVAYTSGGLAVWASNTVR